MRDTFVPLQRGFFEFRENVAPQYETSEGWVYRGPTLGWRDLLTRRLVVVLGEVGAGKTKEFQHQSQQLREAGKDAFFFNLQLLAEDNFTRTLPPEDLKRLEAWSQSNRGAIFFLDALDEAKLSRSDTHIRALRRLRDYIGHASSRAQLFLSCRITEWESLDKEQLRSLLSDWASPLGEAIGRRGAGSEGLFVVVLAPLTPAQVGKLAEAWGAPDIDSFQQALLASRTDKLAARPLDVLWLVDYWKIHRSLGTLTELFQHALQERLSPQGRDPRSLQDAWRAAERLAAAVGDLSTLVLQLQQQTAEIVRDYSSITSLDVPGLELTPPLTELSRQAFEVLQESLPSGWDVRLLPGALSPREVRVQLQGPDQAKALLRLMLRHSLAPKDALSLVEQSQAAARAEEVWVAPYLSPRTRDILRKANRNYLDPTGNLSISLSRPALLLERQGASQDPTYEARGTRSLKGAKAGRIVRALCDFKDGVGVRALAERAGVNAGYASRVLDLLEKEALIVREPRGPVTKVRWRELLARWAQDHPLQEANKVHRYLEPRGLSALEEKLASFHMPYALTGSMGASRVAPVAPPRLAICYLDDPKLAAQRLGLRTAETGINVLLLKSFDSVVYERTWTRDHLRFVAVSQLAADLLTSPGRGPEEGKSLLDWMEAHEDEWRQ